jgi:hypothetical protein
MSHQRAARIAAVRIAAIAARTLARRIAVPILVLGLAVAACRPPSPSPDQNGAAPASTGTARAELVLGCISIQAAECRLVAERIVASLPVGRGDPFAIEIQAFPCDIPNAPCPKSLAVRTGKAVVEFLDGGEPLDLTLQGPPERPFIARQDALYLGLSNPSSARVNGAGPFEFEIGHCGLLHVIDFDGSFWLPTGQVDGDSPTIVNSEAGTMRLIGANLAEFRGRSGFTVQLARFPGPKHFWGCD